MPNAPDALHRFACAACGAEAGLVRLCAGDGYGEIVRRSFTGELTRRVAADEFERAGAALRAGDARGLYELDLEVASFYCPGCAACYCGEHWVRRDVLDDDEGFFWHDSVRGRCPEGHERMLED